MSHLLSYSPPEHWHKRPSVRRFLGCFCVAIGALYLCVVLRGVPGRLALMHKQAVLEVHSWPPGYVVYADRGPWSSGAAQWTTHIERIPSWNDICNTTPGDAVCFVHRLQAPGNAPRIVGVECVLPRSTADLVLSAKVIQPGNLRHIPFVWRENYYDIRLTGPDHGVTIFGGRADPTNARHFTIEYQFGGKKHTIDGWLEPDDSVKLEPRP